LRKWEKEEKIEAIRAPGGKRLYSVESLDKLFHVETKKKEKVCYTRVSSAKQKEDLERQVESLKTKYPEHRIIQDIGSGLNWKRKGFTSILESVYIRDIEEVVVLHKDRLCRFGIELVEFIFEKAGCKLLVHNKNDHHETTAEQELAEDLLSIVTVFVARNNGKRQQFTEKTEVLRIKKEKAAIKRKEANLAKKIMKEKEEMNEPEGKKEKPIKPPKKKSKRTLKLEENKIKNAMNPKKNPKKEAPKEPKLPKMKKAPAAKTKKIRLNPTNRQKRILRKWFGTCRWFIINVFQSLRKMEL